MNHTIAIYGNTFQCHHTHSLQTFFDALAEHTDKIRVIIEKDFADYLHRLITLPEACSATFDRVCAEAALVLSIGGDGTFLTTASCVGSLSTPIMGLNTGHLGYLAAAKLSDEKKIINYIGSGQYEADERSLISVELHGAELHCPAVALNEVAILKQDTASMITVGVHLDDDLLADYNGDGLLVSTPTGSTGYNLSVGGPIIAPSAPTYVISPIATHSLTMRPLVVDDSCTLEINVKSRSGSYLLSIDGRSEVLPVSASLTLRKAPYKVKVAHLPGYSFIDTLRTKLLWGV